MISKKYLFPWIACGLAITCIPLAAQTQEARSEAEVVPASSESESMYPIGRECVVTLDSQSKQTPQFAGDSKIPTGLSAPDVVEGELIADRGHWLVIKTPGRENWIPKSKILLISFND